MIEESQSFDEHDFLVADGLSMAYHTFEGGIPQTLAKSAAHVKKIDLTETSMRNFENLQWFTKVETIILDKNGLTDIKTCPALPTLRTLWCNNNAIVDLPAFFDDVTKKFPNLRYLSMMRNPGCPGLMDIVNPDLEAIRMYRLYVLFRCPQLLELDCEKVGEAERAEAKLRGQYAIKRRASAAAAPAALLPAVPVMAGADAVAAAAAIGSGPGGAGAGAGGGGTDAGTPDGKAGSGGTIKVSAPRGNSKNSEGNRFIGNALL